jgi:hypothetical protein
VTLKSRDRFCFPLYWAQNAILPSVSREIYTFPSDWVLKVARTIADLEAAPKVISSHIEEKLFNTEVWIVMVGWGSLECCLNWNGHGLQIRAIGCINFRNIWKTKKTFDNS